MSSGPPVQPPYQQPPQQGDPYAQPQYQQPPYQPQDFSQNPYTQPQAPHLQQGYLPSKRTPPGALCPRCGSPYLVDVKYTWWGGLVGPSMMSLVRCQNCKLQFNGKTGKDAKGGILVYTLVAVGIGVAVGVCAVVFHWWG